MNHTLGAARIRAAIDEVQALRQLSVQRPELRVALHQIKTFQCARFASSYRDLLAQPAFAPACTFFLQELYSAKDFEQRDAEFSRIAGALERLFPQSIVAIAVALADLHMLTEHLDMQMAAALASEVTSLDNAPLPEALYRTAWKLVGAVDKRQQQLDSVLELGQSLQSVVRLPGIRLTLRAMRGPAKAAKLAHLQAFLENGFDTFANLARVSNGVEQFLDTVQTRETLWMRDMSDEYQQT